jgi:hypothetical protein
MLNTYGHFIEDNESETARPARCPVPGKVHVPHGLQVLAKHPVELRWEIYQTYGTLCSFLATFGNTQFLEALSTGAFQTRLLSRGH